MAVTLQPLRRADMPAIAGWRNEVRDRLRTPFVLTDEMQTRWYDDVVCDRRAPHRYWGIHRGFEPICGMVGLTDIEWENGRAEVSLIIDPNLIRQGIGSVALALVLNEAFDRLRLVAVVAECYHSNPALSFWLKHAARYGADVTTLPLRKYSQGLYHDAAYITFQTSWPIRRASRLLSDRSPLIAGSDNSASAWTTVIGGART